MILIYQQIFSVCKLYEYSEYYLFYLYIYPPDLQKSNGGTNRYGRQLPRSASGDAKILLSTCNLKEI